MPEVIVNLPEFIENAGLPAPEVYTFYKGLESRMFWMDDEINSYSLEMARQIIIWNEQDEKNNIPVEKRQPIKIIFFSPGGELDVSNALIDVITMSKTPIYGYNIGLCASGAAFIYLCCHKRFMTKKAYFLFHQGQGAFSGSFQEVCQQMEDYQHQIEELANYMVSYTKYTEEEVDNNIIGEWFIHSDEALQKGVCDEIITDIKVLI